MDDLLDDDEMARWVTWKRATDGVWDQVVREITTATTLSSADFSVLTRVVESDAPPRQQELADALGWQRSRLSRQLTRMAERGLLERVPGPDAPVIRATKTGRAVARRARTAHARAVRAALLSRVPQSGNSALWRTLATLGDAPADRPDGDTPRTG